jgi:hypothetical protein
MKPGFETQREVEQFFAGKNDEDSIWIREGLYSINQQRFICCGQKRGREIPPSNRRTTRFRIPIAKRRGEECF